MEQPAGKTQLSITLAVVVVVSVMLASLSPRAQQPPVPNADFIGA